MHWLKIKIKENGGQGDRERDRKIIQCTASGAVAQGLHHKSGRGTICGPRAARGRLGHLPEARCQQGEGCIRCARGDVSSSSSSFSSFSSSSSSFYLIIKFLCFSCSAILRQPTLRASTCCSAW